MINNNHWQKISQNLWKIRRPARYIGKELNSVYKEDAEVRVALAFPDTYEVGNSHYGLQIMYSAINEVEWANAERVYMPERDMIEFLQSNNIPLFTLESKSSLKEFDLVGFTLQYELSYTNILKMLEMSNIEFLSKNREEIVIAGGPNAFKPEPLADYIDLFVIGDGEDVTLKLLDLKREIKDKDNFLKNASQIEGVYVPKFFKPILFSDINPKVEKIVKRAIVKDINKYNTKLIVPNVEAVHHRATIEVMRGCDRGCRFCFAGMIYRPVRERAPEKLIEDCVRLKNETGMKEIGLLSLSTADYTGLQDFMELYLSNSNLKDMSLSIPSTRMDSFNLKIAQDVSKNKKSGLTFAPEAATQRLRDVINKNITEEDIFNTASQARMAGWRKIKLYFMIGLPTETLDDVREIGNLVKKIKRIGFRDVNVTVSVFIPQPHTPFQYARQNGPEEIKEKIRIIKDSTKKVRGIKIRANYSFKTIVEGIFSRGDREVGKLLLSAYKNGALFDDWKEEFNEEAWKKAIENTIDPDMYLGEISTGRVLPWDFIDTGITKKFLISEYKKAIEKGKTTGDCRFENCKGCGICLGEIKNVLVHPKY
jgi:radical SAM family uncharacterized protein